MLIFQPKLGVDHPFNLDDRRALSAMMKELHDTRVFTVVSIDGV
jgi:hypothetical protein